MPEGPEVETIRRGLEASIVGQIISFVDVIWPGSMPIGAENANDVIRAARVIKIYRRAKILLIELDNGYSLMFHLKMTGQIVFVKSTGEKYAGGHPSESMARSMPVKSTRIVIGFESGDRLYFNDQRKFGWVKLVRSVDVEADPLVSRLGPEVLSPDFTHIYLKSQLDRHSRSSIKAVILDQSTVGGIGNIYADESLHLARIHPARLAGSITESEARQLRHAIRDIITTAISSGGTSFSHYVNALGAKGDYLFRARVFRRNGLPCPRCAMVIEKIRVAGRGTHLCPTCQVMS